MNPIKSKEDVTRQAVKKPYRVQATAQIEVEIEVDACDPEQAAAMAEAWTQCATGTCWYDGYYDHHLKIHVDERFDLDWEICDVFQCDAETVELLQDEDDADSKEGEV